MIRHAITACCWLVAAAAGVPAAWAGAPSAAQAQAELQALRARIGAVQSRLAAAEAKHSEAADALAESERAISGINRTLGRLEERTREIDARLTALEEEVRGLERRLATEEAALRSLLYRQYVAGRPESLNLVLNGHDPTTVARELHYFTYIATARAERIGALRANRKRLDALTAEAREQRARLAATVAEQTTQRARLQAQTAARSAILERTAGEIARQRREIGTLARDETRLARLVEELARALARAQRQRTPPGGARLRNERLPGPAHDGVPFARLQGRLALPVRGELGNRFGSPRQGGGVVWRGLFIAAPAGSEVRAVAAGRVVFADWLRGFGNLLIIDHGGSYMSLYGYNQALFKQVGEVIRGGETVAAVGNSGGQPESGLYFELRHEGRPFDPMAWVNVR